MALGAQQLVFMRSPFACSFDVCGVRGQGPGATLYPMQCIHLLGNDHQGDAPEQTAEDFREGVDKQWRRLVAADLVAGEGETVPLPLQAVHHVGRVQGYALGFTCNTNQNTTPQLPTGPKKHASNNTEDQARIRVRSSGFLVAFKQRTLLWLTSQTSCVAAICHAGLLQWGSRIQCQGLMVMQQQTSSFLLTKHNLGRPRPLASPILCLSLVCTFLFLLKMQSWIWAPCSLILRRELRK